MNNKKKFEPRRFRIYKLSTFDALTDEERSYHMSYKEAKKEKVLAKKTRDKCIASYKGVRKIDRNRLYLYDYDDKGIIQLKRNRKGKVIVEPDWPGSKITTFE